MGFFWGMKFFKYHALGNDYLVIDPRDVSRPLTTTEIKIICHRHFGVGSDGILWGPEASATAQFGLRIFNPDGSEAEKAAMACGFFHDIYGTKKKSEATNSPFKPPEDWSNPG